MTLKWAKPLPLLLMTAPMLLMWAPARAFFGAAVSKLPRYCLIYKVLSRRRRSSASTDLRCGATTSAGSQDDGVGEARKVVVITGPTATGKSSIALELCKQLDGELVSCDSVQVYRNLSIGCNKPTEEDTREVRHHLVDIAALSETFTAGEFVALAQEAIDDILTRGRVPVVVGGTMMYVQWLVQGKPDAPKKDRPVAQAVAKELLPFHERGDWDGALQILAAESETRAASLSRNDWYRLSRSLEVLRGAKGKEAFTGTRKPLGTKYDFRSFFIVGDRERLFRRIDRRCEEMVSKGLLCEVAGLLEQGILDPASPAGRAIGYRQTIEFLLQEAKLADDSESRSPTEMTEGTEDLLDPESRFLQFLMTFAARTRQYAADQIKWFRSPKGRDFYWQLWDLGGPIKEGPCRRTRNRRGSSSVAVSRAGDGCSLKVAAKSIAESYKLSQEEFDRQLNGEYQEAVRVENQMRATDMKTYTTKLSLFTDRNARKRLVEEIRGLAKNLRESNIGRQEGAAAGGGWYAGIR